MILAFSALHRSFKAFDYWLTVGRKCQGIKRSCPSHLPPRWLHQDKPHSSPFTSHCGACSRVIVPSHPLDNLAGRLLFLMSRHWKKVIFQFDWVVLMRMCWEKLGGSICFVFGSPCFFYWMRHVNGQHNRSIRWINYRLWKGKKNSCKKIWGWTFYGTQE